MLERGELRLPRGQARFWNFHSKTGDTVVMFLDLLGKRRAEQGDASLRLVSFSIPQHIVFDYLFNGKMTIFNRHYDDYALVVQQIIAIVPLCMAYAIVLDLGTFNATNWATVVKSLQSTADENTCLMCA